MIYNVIERDQISTGLVCLLRPPLIKVFCELFSLSKVRVITFSSKTFIEMTSVYSGKSSEIEFLAAVPP